MFSSSPLLLLLRKKKFCSFGKSSPLFENKFLEKKTCQYRQTFQRGVFHVSTSSSRRYHFLLLLIHHPLRFQPFLFRSKIEFTRKCFVKNSSCERQQPSSFKLSCLTFPSSFAPHHLQHHCEMMIFVFSSKTTSRYLNKTDFASQLSLTLEERVHKKIKSTPLFRSSEK